MRDPKQSKCRSCDAPVYWAVHKDSGKKNPIDVAPVADGNIELTASRSDPDKLTWRILREGEDPQPGHETYVSHFATCPHSTDHRKRA